MKERGTKDRYGDTGGPAFPRADARAGHLAVRNGGDDQVVDTCFRFLVPTKERSSPVRDV